MHCNHLICGGDTCELAPRNAIADLERELASRRLVDLERARARRSFRAFVEMAWSTIEPTRALLPSHAVDAMCAALQAVAEGRIKRLAIATCPGTSKSLIGSVAFPAWLLLRTGGTARVMAGSYSWDFAERDSRRCRDLITSPFYQSLVGDAWTIRDDADKRSDYWTSTGGRRLIVSPAGKALGERCSIQILDDALSGADVHSQSAKREAARWLCEVLPSRLEDPDRDARVLVGQRLCVDDPLAIAIEQGWSVLSLPALLSEGDEPCELRDDAGALVWRDPRAPGEPLVSLLSVDALARLKHELGSSAFQAQYMCRPADDSAAVVKRSWWRWFDIGATSTRRPAGCTDAPAVKRPEAFERVVITADLSFGAVKGDYAAVQSWGVAGAGRYALRLFRKRCGFEEQVAIIEDFAREWPTARIVIEKAANGHAAIETLSKRIPNVCPVIPRGSKPSRMAAIAPAVESGCVYLPDDGGELVTNLVEECAGAKHDDAADACAYALLDLAVDITQPSEVERWIAMGDGNAESKLKLARLRHARGAPITDAERKLIEDANMAEWLDDVDSLPIVLRKIKQGVPLTMLTRAEARAYFNRAEIERWLEERKKKHGG